MLNSHPVGNLDLGVDELVSALLGLADSETVCVLDSSGVSHLGSHLLIAGIEPIETLSLNSTDPDSTLATLDQLLSRGLAAVFTLSYEFGRKIQGFKASQRTEVAEPDIFIALFDVLVVHDYDLSSTKLVGNQAKFAAIKERVLSAPRISSVPLGEGAVVRSDFTREAYLKTVEEIKERIRRGDTYQTNLTQRLTGDIPNGITAAHIFREIRTKHPAPFAAFIARNGSTVISASPERFFRIDDRTITTSPIKGTRPRGRTAEKDRQLREELLTSAKDRAENTMIVDLLRNDLGRVCEYGSITVEKLCELEEHPTLFHLVSTVSGRLRRNTPPSSVLRALFPCGSITGAPKISTMRIIDELEHSSRGLSMGAIGYYVPPAGFELPGTLDTSVAIRTAVVRDRTVTFNVGGGIVIDSDRNKEYDETLIKAAVLTNALNARLDL